jgi:Cytochrome C'
LQHRHPGACAVILGLCLAVTCKADTGQSTEKAAERVIEDRVAKFREIGAAEKHIKDEVASKTPDLNKIRESARLIRSDGADILQWFPPGSQPPPEPPRSWLDTILGWFSSANNVALVDQAKSHAKPLIWTEQAKFQQLHARFSVEADRMWRLAEHGNVVEISAQNRRLGERCKACHDMFREKLD